jgi:hypothetical protein
MTGKQRFRVRPAQMRLLAFAANCMVVLGVLLAGSLVARAQDTTTVVGTVTDSSGAVITGATVNLTNSLNGTKFTQTTDNKGSYRFIGVPTTSGYQLTFSKGGFAIEEISDITLYVGTTRTQNATLKPAGANTQVEVTGHSTDVTIDTTDATIGNNIDVDVLNDLPVYDRLRGVSTLFTMQAGVDLSQGAVTGARIDQSQTNVDGVDANDVTIGQTFYVVGGAPIDSLEQFNGSVAGLTPGVGTGSGGQYSLVTKSGTNHFHGNVNEYNRTTVTTANPWFNNLKGVPRTPLIQNQFGGNLGGPIKRDKIFFFFNYSASRIVQSSTTEPTVPLTAMRSGELNYINSGSGCGYQSRLNTQANCITTASAAEVASLDPQGAGYSPNVLQMISSRYPTATDLTAGDGVNTGGAPFTYGNPYNETNYVGKGDYNLTQKQRISGRYTFDKINAVESAPEFKGDPATSVLNYISYSYVLSHDWTLGNNKLNQFSIGLAINKPQFPNNFYPAALKGEYFSYTGITAPYGGPGWQGRRTSVPTLRDDFTWQKGSHGFAFGGTYKWMLEQFTLVSDYYSVSLGEAGNGLSGGLTPNLRPADINEDGSGVANRDWDGIFPTALGVIGEVSANFNYNNKQQALPPMSGSNSQYHHDELEAYFGDTWKFNRKLTFTYGVRYQMYTAPYEIHGLESVAQIAGTGGFMSYDKWFSLRQQMISADNYTPSALPNLEWVLGGKANHGPNYFNPSKTDFAPRVSFAYSPYASGKTVFNGSAGITYDRTALGTLNFLQNQLSFLFENSNTNNIFNSSAYTTLQTNPRIGSNYGYSSSLNPAPLPLTVPYTPYIDSNGVPTGLPAYGEAGSFQFDQNMKDPYYFTFNFGLQQQLRGGFVMKVNWAERLGRRLLADIDGNQIVDSPDPTHKSTQTMVQAFAGLTRDVRAQQSNPNAPIHPEPFFEDVQGTVGQSQGAPSNTALDAALLGNYALYGDMGDSMYVLSLYDYYAYPGLWRVNLGTPWQFGGNGWMTNMGNSNYNGLLFTLDKNPTHGLRFEFNYTWSHSIDNTSEYANQNGFYAGTGFICDYYHPRACRGDSDFDVRQTINSYFTYQLPIGRGKTFASSISRWADEAIGGWEISGIPSYRTGVALSAMSNAYIASMYNNVAATWYGTSKGQLTSHVNIDRSTNFVYMFKGGATGAANILNQFQGPVGLQYGNRNLIRGPGAFNMDASLGKTFPVYEKVNVKFRADAFNVLNHPDFGASAGGVSINNTGLNIVNNAGAFGQISATSNSARVMQGSLRLEF